MPDVISYVNYLHEVSRKILQRSGFENVLFGKSSRQNPMYCALNEPAEKRARHVSAVHRLVRDTPGRGLYVGLGLIVGRHQSTRKHRIAAPLLYCPVDLLAEDDGQLDYEIDWPSHGLNYDLLALLLGGAEDQEEEEFRVDERISAESLQRLSELEEKLDQQLSSGEGQQAALSPRGIEAFFAELRPCVAKLKETPTAPSPYRKEELEGLIEKGDFIFFPHSFFFVAPVAEQLSTTVALQRLVQQCKTGGFENPLLKKLFESVLENRGAELQRDLPHPPGEILDSVPLPLSERQRAAITKAWQNEISYIQGPPGTGKSHTITATILAGLLMGKRVLMVSHKTPAVERVHEMLADILGPDAVVYLGPKPEQRKDLRGTLQRRLSASGASRSRQLQALKQRHGGELEQLLRERAVLLRDLAASLEAERTHFEKHSAFLKARKNLQAHFEIESERSIRVTDSTAGLDRYERILGRLDRTIDACREQGQLSRLEAMLGRRAFKIAKERFQADQALMRPDHVCSSYLRGHLALTRAALDAGAARRRIKPGTTAALRRQLETVEDQLNERKKLSIRAQMDHLICSQLKTTADEVERFGKMLHWKRHSKILEAMESIDFDAVTATFPLWVGEMRHLGEFLPFASSLFHMVIVDEASQVNIAEITPAFYRGSRLCVVGDKKQLGLNAAGLFSLNRKFEELVWNQCLGDRAITCAQGDERALLVSKNSILDFITCPANRFTIARTVLNEHFRSLPQLASYTSDRFYADDGGLKLMRELPKNLSRQCFQLITVGGQREEDVKLVKAEVDEVLKRIVGLIRQKSYLSDPMFRTHLYSEQRPPTIGVISFLTDQRNYLRTQIDEFGFEPQEINRHKLFVGTPEDFQGNERNIMFLTFGLDGISKWAPGHYQNPNRFNVATSRAIDAVVAVIGGIPANAHEIVRFFRHFGADVNPVHPNGDPSRAELPSEGRFAWRYRSEARESEFEVRVDEHLHGFINSSSNGGEVKLYNQVQACGEKRLDFVLYNATNGECCAIEVDGRDHFCQDGRSYSEEHLDRVDVLKRAGWKMIHVPYYEWYRNGWLCDQDSADFTRWLGRFYTEIRASLGIAPPPK